MTKNTNSMKRYIPVVLSVVALALCTAANQAAAKELPQTTISRSIHAANGVNIGLSIQYTQPVLAFGTYGLTGTVHATYNDGVTQFTATSSVSCTGMADSEVAVAALVVTGTSGLTGDLVAGTYNLLHLGINAVPGNCVLGTSVTPSAASHFAATKQALYSEVMSDLGQFDATAAAKDATLALFDLGLIKLWPPIEGAELQVADNGSTQICGFTGGIIPTRICTFYAQGIVTLGGSAVGVSGAAVTVCSLFNCAFSTTDPTGGFAAVLGSPSSFQTVSVTATLDPYYAGVALLGNGTTSVGGAGCSGACN